MDELAKKIEAVLMYKGEPVKKAWLEKVLERDAEEVEAGINRLKELLAGRGVVLMEVQGEFTIRTAPQYSELIASIRKEELSQNLGKAALETLSIVLYRGPVTRAEIDYIRGVHSTFILRSLLIRGLIEKVSNPKDSRGFLYRPTFKLLSYLGVSNLSELPEYEKIQNEIEAFQKNARSREVVE